MLVTGHTALFKNLKTIFRLVFFFILLCPNFCFSQSYPDHQVDSLLTDGINELISQNYSGARNVFLTLDKNYPDIPFGKIYLAALEIARSFDLKFPYKTGYIDSNLNEALNLSQKRYDNNPMVWNKYFVALSKGYLAYFAAINKNWLSALNQGYDSMKDFDDCLSRDSSFFDCYIAIGTFEYWKSKKVEFLNWLPFFSDNSQKGIELLYKAIDHNSYNKYLAVYSLQWILINEKKYQDVVKLSDEVLAAYPKSRFFKWALGRAYEEIDVQKSIEIYENILNSYEKDTLTVYNEILLKHLIAQQYEKIGEFQKSIKLCDEILNIRNLGNYGVDYLEKRIDRVKKLRAKLEDEIKSPK
jgi:tetratricopeptide (TPR) repeat protein